MSCQGSKPGPASRPLLTGQRANQSMSGRSVAICSRKTATLTTISAWVTGGMGRNAIVPRRRRSSGVQLRVAAEDPLLVERDAALRAQVFAESRPPGDALVQLDQARDIFFQAAHRPREGVAQPLDHLEEGQLDVGKGPELYLFEVLQELRQAFGPEVRRAPLCFWPLVLVIEAAADRVMGVVHLGQPVGDGELQLVQPQPAGLAPGGKAQAGPEVEEDVRGLGDQQLTGAQERRRERRSLDGRALEHVLHRLHAARTARNVEVIGARVLEREADELAAPLDGRPVIERVSHRIICVWIVSDSSLPESSVTRVCQTCVRLPLWRAVDSARSLPAVAAAKKLVFDSSVAVFRPIAEVPTAPMVSANAISVPPCTAPVVVFRCSPISSSPTTRSGATSTRRIPRCAISPVLH